MTVYYYAATGGAHRAYTSLFYGVNFYAVEMAHKTGRGVALSPDSAYAAKKRMSPTGENEPYGTTKPGPLGVANSFVPVLYTHSCGPTPSELHAKNSLPR